MQSSSHRKNPFALAVRRSAAGLGVFAEENIPKRRFVLEYWGDVVTDDEANRLGGKYLFSLGNGKTINGTMRKNVARYVNHSCRPNCEVRVVGNKVFISAKRRISAGEELNYDYGKEYFNFFIAPHGCRCAKHR